MLLLFIVGWKEALVVVTEVKWVRKVIRIMRYLRKHPLSVCRLERVV